MKNTITKYERELLDLLDCQAGAARLQLDNVKSAMAHLLLVDESQDECADDWLDELVYDGNRDLANLFEVLGVDITDPVAGDDEDQADGPVLTRDEAQE